MALIARGVMGDILEDQIVAEGTAVEEEDDIGHKLS